MAARSGHQSRFGWGAKGSSSGELPTKQVKLSYEEKKTFKALPATTTSRQHIRIKMDEASVPVRRSQGHAKVCGPPRSTCIPLKKKLSKPPKGPHYVCKDALGSRVKEQQQQPCGGGVSQGEIAEDLLNGNEDGECEEGRSDRQHTQNQSQSHLTTTVSSDLTGHTDTRITSKPPHMHMDGTISYNTVTPVSGLCLYRELMS